LDPASGSQQVLTLESTQAVEEPVGIAGHAGRESGACYSKPLAASQRSASSAAMQPVPAAVIACR
jgi:hypothetical protein